MATLFLTFLVLGGSVLAIQFVLGIFGGDGESGLDDPGIDGGVGLDLFTVRALSAAAAFFGVTGVGLMQWGVPGWLAAFLAVGVGFGAAVGVAYLMRSMKRLEVDKSFRIDMTIGLPARVALGIPGARSGEGKVFLNAHSRFLELNAVTTDEAIPTGSEVFVVDTISSDTVLVSRTPLLPEESHVPR